jgi:hypothetical protein
MIVVSERSTPTCIVVEAEGAISGDEYEAFAKRFEDAVRDQGSVALVVELAGPVSYGDREAFGDDWRFAFRQYRHASRAAFVSEQHLVNAMMRVFSPFTRTEERIFAPGELDAAIEWACSAG